MFRLLSRFFQARHWHAGHYELNQNDNLITLVQKIRHGDSLLASFTLLPGKQLSDLKQQFARQQLTFEPLLCVYAGCHQGFLPETYYYDPYTSSWCRFNDSNAKNHFSQHLSRWWQARDPNITPVKNLDELIVLASMLEAESADFDEQRLIAGVIVNRLKVDMPLQIDATVKTALQLAGMAGAANCGRLQV